MSLHYFEVLSSVVPTYLLSNCTGLLMTIDDKGNELYLPLVPVESNICVWEFTCPTNAVHTEVINLKGHPENCRSENEQAHIMFCWVLF